MTTSHRDRPALVLASGSPRRTRLLDEWGIHHVVDAPCVDEDVDPGLDAGAVAEGLAVRKARDVASRRRAAGWSGWILAADTVVSVAGAHLGKPRDAADAILILRRLSGRVVLVVTGVAVFDPAGGLRSSHALTSVHMKPFSERVIQDYVATGEPLDKAGAFGIQGLGRALVDRVDGSVTNVIGLPRELVLDELAQSGFRDGTGPASGPRV